MEESEKAVLEVAKIKGEIRKLNWENTWPGRVVLSPLIAAVIAVVGLGIGISNFGSQQRFNREAAQEAHAGQFKQRFWEARLDVYARATKAAAKIANAPKLMDEDSRVFLELYWGELSILEDQQVVEAMIAFREQLDEVNEGKRTTTSLRNAAYALSQACRKSLQATWEPVPLYDLRPKK